MTWTVGIRAAGIPLQLAVFTLVARLQPLHDVGVYAVANAVWQAFKALGPLGLDIAAMRFSPQLAAEQRASEVQDLEKRSQRLVVLLNLCAGAVVAVAGISPLGTYLRMEPSVAIVVGAGIPIYALVGLQLGQLRARNMVGAAQVPESIIYNVCSFLLIATAWIVGRKSIVWTLAATVTSIVVVAALNQRAFSRLHVSERSPVERHVASQVQRVATNMFFGQALTTAASRAPTLLIGAIAGSGSAGLFEAASRVGQLASVGTWAAGIAASPLFSAAYTKGNRERVQDLLIASSWSAFIPALGVWFAVLLLGRKILVLFGSDFPAAYGVAVLVSLATAVNAGGGLSASLLYMVGRERVVVRFSAAAVLTLMTGTCFLLPVLGLNGVGVAMVLGAVIRDVGPSLILPRLVGVQAGVFSWQSSRRMLSLTRRRFMERLVEK